tara:strand:+ start:28954 stop:29355 length:402 start_codon:yes stop_codon:yes gene_type:complete
MIANTEDYLERAKDLFEASRNKKFSRFENRTLDQQLDKLAKELPYDKITVTMQLFDFYEGKPREPGKEDFKMRIYRSYIQFKTDQEVQVFCIRPSKYKTRETRFGPVSIDTDHLHVNHYGKRRSRNQAGYYGG